MIMNKTGIVYYLVAGEVDDCENIHIEFSDYFLISLEYFKPSCNRTSV